jgi:hypothetical protein
MMPLLLWLWTTMIYVEQFVLWSFFLTQLFLHGLKGTKVNYYIITESKKEDYKEIILRIFVLETSSNT